MSGFILICNNVFYAIYIMKNILLIVALFQNFVNFSVREVIFYMSTKRHIFELLCMAVGGWKAAVPPEVPAFRFYLNAIGEKKSKTLGDPVDFY